MALDETGFHQRADTTLRRLMDAFDSQDDLDTDLRDGILTIELEGGAQYVVNKHAPNREIWVSSPKSGAWHFAFDDARKAWVDTRAHGTSMPMTLEKLLGSELDVAIASE